MPSIAFQWQQFLGIFSFQWQQVLDVLIVSVLFYYLIYLVRGTKTAIVFQGILIVSFVYYICRLFQLLTLVWILEKVLFVGPIALLVIFTPEIRQFLERAGRMRFLLRQSLDSEPASTAEVCSEIHKAVHIMSEAKIGGLIGITRVRGDQSVLDHVVLGVRMDADVSSELLLTIFNKESPLHDGAVIVDGGKILYAASFFPLSDREQPIKIFGTRHIAGIGITERADMIVAVVSESTGAISLCYNGRIAYNLTLEQFDELLRELLIPDTTRLSILPRVLVE